MNIRLLATILLAVTGVAGFAQGAVPDVKDAAPQHDWARFRGPNGYGVSTATGIPTTWSKDQNVLWKTDLPKPLKFGSVTRKQLEDLPNAYDPWSSPIIVAGKVFLASAGVKVDEHRLLCFNLADGKQLWEKHIPPGPIVLSPMSNLLDNVDWVKTKDGPPRKNTHTAFGYGICTPCSDGERVFVTFSSYVLTALDFQGNILWQKPLAKTTDKLGMCLGASPIVYNDMVIQACDSSIKAFDCKTGDVKYETPLPFGEGWSTPILVSLKGKTVLIDSNSGLRGIDPGTGQLLWEVKSYGAYGTSPVYDAGYLYGYYRASASVFALAVGEGATVNATKDTRWTYMKKGEVIHSSPLIVDGILYRYSSVFSNEGLMVGIPAKYKGGADTSTLYGIDTTTGTVTSTTLMPGVSNWTSPVATADGYIYLATGGKSYVIKAGPKPEIVGVNDLDDYNVSPSPAVADGKLIIRGNSKLWCIGKP